ncbi:MAG TPA: chemotaxis protein CheX, partial [Anaerolineae bacterium]|nr:chemotaxis protein CheX [Anaerolineae bacterium]
LNPFITAAAEVLEAETGTTLERGEVSLQQATYTTDDVTTVLTLVGDVVGVVLYDMPTQMALALVSKILGQRFEELDELAQSGIGELGNVITGRAGVKLATSGYETRLSVPTLIIGRGTTVSTLDLPHLVVPLHTQYGTMRIHLALRENRNGKGNWRRSRLDSSA